MRYKRCACGRRKIDGKCSATVPCIPKPHRRIASEHNESVRRTRRAIAAATSL